MDGVPDGGSVTLPVATIREWLEDSSQDDEPVSDLTVEEVAKIVDRAPSTVRGWLVSDEIPQAYKFKGEWRVPPAALEAFFEHKRSGSSKNDEKNGNLAAWRDLV